MARRLPQVLLGLAFVLVPVPPSAAQVASRSAAGTPTKRRPIHELRDHLGVHVEAFLRVFLPGSQGRCFVEATYDEELHFTLQSAIRFAFESAAGQASSPTKYVDGHVVGLFSPTDGLVVVVSEGASRLAVSAFRLHDGKATLVLAGATKFQPEFAWDAMVLSTGWVPLPTGACCTAKWAEIWCWTGETYKLAAKVPIDQKYQALARIERENGR